ncbi:hypothetical protein F5H01DRAFT_156935, partial [Linnemannia elongata]
PKTRFATLIKTRPSAPKKRYKKLSLTPLALLHNTQPRLPLSSLSLFPLQHLSTRATQHHFHTPIPLLIQLSFLSPTLAFIIPLQPSNKQTLAKMSSLSALRRPRPLSLTAPRRIVAANLSTPRGSEHGVLSSAGQRGHVRWASLAHFDIGCSTPPPPPPMTLEQVDKVKQTQQQHRQRQQQMQLESEQRLRQQQELQQTLAKDRAMLIKQQRQRQRPGSWSGTVASLKAFSEVEERPIRHVHLPPVREHGRSLSISYAQSLSRQTPTTSSSPLLNKCMTGSRPKSMFALKGDDQKMRLSTAVASSTSTPQSHSDATLESSTDSHWDSRHQGLETHQEE